MKRRTYYSTLILILLFASGCRSFNADSEKWEGISGNVLKVTVSEFFPFNENVTNENIEAAIKDRLNQRASLIIASYITINLPRNTISHDTDILLNNLINNIINDGKVINYECNDYNYCSAHSEYNITELQNNLERLKTDGGTENN